MLDQLGRLEEAIASCDKAIKFKPDYYQAWINRGIEAGKSINSNQLFTFPSPIAIKNPALNQRSYEGRLASYQEGLKFCPIPNSQNSLCSNQNFILSYRKTGPSLQIKVGPS